ncbi:MAG: FAD/NAD(P)-binding protein [Sphingomonas sp.]|nr:FAD/NAD(P)-binding protein [Sphingomonas sp.]
MAVQLARRGIRSQLIDGSGRLGRGVAYSTNEPAHLLNVPAERMSALAGEPDHFARIFEAEGGDRRGFAERRLFGRYLRGILDEAVEKGCIKIIEATAVGASRQGDGWQVHLNNRSSLETKGLVLAAGNQEPAALGEFEQVGDRFVRDPWDATARAAVEDLANTGAAALIVGTGLTMVDLVLSLEAAGHQGRIVALSRRGLAPRSHANTEPAPVDQSDIPQGSVIGLLRWLRRRSAEVGWRPAVDSLRPFSHVLWQGFDVDQQRRFLRHARPYWDVHRHRIAPEVGQTVARLIGGGRLEILAGRISTARETDRGLEVGYRKRAAEADQSMTFGYAFNCTGPLHTMSRSRDPMLRSLLDAGEVAPDHLNIGLSVDENCRAGEHLWAMGPLTKGRYWEIIAVPDIREQAAAVADDIKRELGE